MFEIAGGIALGFVGCVVAFFALAFALMYSAEAYNHVLALFRRWQANRLSLRRERGLVTPAKVLK